MEVMVEIPIKVLIIEDTDDDKELILRKLKRGGYIPEYECIQTREELVDALDVQHWDLILCDYSMPEFDGLTALKIVKQKAVDIPFVLISGTVGEDIAVEAMKSGAQDYMMKDNLIRLIPVVKRELAEAKMRKEKKIADEEIKKHHVVLDAIINNTHSMIIFMLDKDYQYVSFNENHRNDMKSVYGADVEIGMNMLDMINIPGVRKRVKEIVDKVLRGNSFVVTEFQPNTKFYYEMHWNAVQKDEEIIGASCFVIDITERKKSEFELIKAKEKAEESDRLKSAFLANMSHEIRTPMNGILGFADLLQNPELEGGEQKRYIDIIKKSGERMLSTVNDIIDISRIESGIVELSISKVNITQQLNELYLFFKPGAAENGNKLVYKNIKSEALEVNTDSEKLNSILTNLIKNAIKHTSNGIIEMGYTLKQINDENHVEFYVRDTGTGIAEDRQKAVFERFVQADIEDRNAKQGSGLGLTISQAYTKMLGGEICLDSELGRGSTFYFTIIDQTECVITPTNKSDDTILEKASVDQNLKALIVEDDEVSDMLLSLMLQEMNCTILHVENGVEALEVCRKNPDLDVIFMDIKIPVLEGYATTRRIRRFNKDVIIIAQTAYGLLGDREKAIEAGCNDYIKKPIDRTALLLLVQKYFNH